MRRVSPHVKHYFSAGCAGLSQSPRQPSHLLGTPTGFGPTPVRPAMTTHPPLQVLVFRHSQDRQVLPYEAAVVRALQGGKPLGGYLAVGDDLGVPVSLFEDAPPRPAAEVLDDYCHTLVLVLVDQKLLDKGSTALWDWIAESWKRCDASDGRHGMLVLPMEEQLRKKFVAKRPRLDEVQMHPAQTLGEDALRTATFGLRVIHECRTLVAGGVRALRDGGRPECMLRLFISHAKADGLPLAQALRNHIAGLKWLASYYDADDLPTGHNWKREVERVAGSAVMVMLRTEEYDDREWCRNEVLWADACGTPAVLVDARTALQYPAAALPFDRVPVVRIPDGNLTRILYAALREALRFLLFRRRMCERQGAGLLPGDAHLRVFSLPPSMPALLDACRSLGVVPPSNGAPRTVVYPDPPLRRGFYEAAAALVAAVAPGTVLTTPDTLAAAPAGLLGRSVEARALTGLRVGVSVSESGDSAHLGFPTEQVNRATVRVAGALIGQGAGVVFGHDWRPDGVMRAVHAFAQQMQPAQYEFAPASAGTAPLVENLLAWPDTPSLPDDVRAGLSDSLRVERAGLPGDLDAVIGGRDKAELATGLSTYATARALTHLRRRLDARIDARFCLGGRTEGFTGRYPGIIEEAMIAVERNTPLYLAGLFGGATRQLIDAVQGGAMPPGFAVSVEGHDSDVARAYAARCDDATEPDAVAPADRVIDPAGVWELFRRRGVEGLSKANRLHPEENLLLFRATSLDAVIELVLLGLGRLRAHSEGDPA